MSGSGDGRAAASTASGAPVPVIEPAGAPSLREVLGAAAVSTGLRLREPDRPGALTDAEARAAASSWGILDPSRAERGAARGGGTVVVLVDGLGLELLRERRGHTPTLRSWLADAEPFGSGLLSAPSGPGPAARTCVPSTTAAALTTLGTGALPGVTGMVGYSVRNPLLPTPAAGDVPNGDDDLCLITWEGRAPDPRAWQDVPTVFQRLEPDPALTRDATGQSAPLAVSVGPARFSGSGLTEAGLRGTRHLAADRLEDRPGLAVSALRRGTPLVYLYVGELDHAGHGHGWRSQEWLRELERLDAAMAELVRRVPRGTRIVLTADHGMVDTDAEHRVTVTDHPGLTGDVAGIAGEPRMAQLYVPGGDPDLALEVATRWREHLGERAAWVGTRAEADALLGPVSPRTETVLGDVLVAMAGTWVVTDPRVHSESAIAMPGVHGSITPAETTIPLLLAQG